MRFLFVIRKKNLILVFAKNPFTKGSGVSD